MTIWIIEPHDSIIVRDGRPFDPTPGARAVSLNFPFPATTTGVLRTTLGYEQGGTFDDAHQTRLKAVAVRGPLLVALSDDGVIKEWFAPAPADALAIAEGTGDDALLQLHRLVPAGVSEDTITDLPADLAPVTVWRSPNDPAVKDKPATMPAFWRWSAFEAWLKAGKPGESSTIKSETLGLSGLTRDERVQIAIQPGTRIAAEGMLFTTSALEFSLLPKRPQDTSRHLGDALRLALALDAATVPTASPTPLTIGGERRIAFGRTSQTAFPACPPDLANQIATDGACRVVLLTPACFKEGFRPKWLLESRAGITPELAAVACDRPQVISGWDLAAGKPKPTRRLAPAGSVYFLHLPGDEAARRKWIDEIWMHCVSDDLQDRLDGFGLAALGTWDGKPQKLF